jgi:hypothetical protein
MNPELKNSLDVIADWLAEISEAQTIRLGLTSDEKKQLNAINRSIAQLQKLNVPIPDDLRQLKLKISSRDIEPMSNPDHDEKLEILNKLIDSLNDLKSKAKRIRSSFKTIAKDSGTKKHYGVQLLDLIESGFISAESQLELQWLKGGEVFEGKLLKDGRVAVRTALVWQEYDSLSTAASKTAGRALNGWSNWRLVESDGRRTSLEKIRTRYLNKERS